jgi:hypothetical protein
MESSQADVTNGARSESRLERWLSRNRPGIGVIAIAIPLLAGVLAMLKYAQLVELPPFGIDRVLVSPVVVGVCFWTLLWPFVALITHLLGLRFELKIPFLKLLRILGRAWILNLLAMILWDTIEIVFLSGVGTGCRSVGFCVWKRTIVGDPLSSGHKECVWSTCEVVSDGLCRLGDCIGAYGACGSGGTCDTSACLMTRENQLAVQFENGSLAS